MQLFPIHFNCEGVMNSESNDSPKLPTIYNKQTKRECASQLRRENKELLTIPEKPSFFSKSSKGSRKSSARPQSGLQMITSQAGQAYLAEIKQSTYYQKKQKLDEWRAQQQLNKQQEEEARQLQIQKEQDLLNQRIDEMMSENGCLQPLIDSSFYLKQDFKDKLYDEFGRDEFVEREKKLAEFLRKINEYNQYASNNEYANVEMDIQLQQLQKEQEEFKLKLQNDYENINNSISVYKKKSDRLTEQISTALGYQQMIRNKREQLLANISEQMQILREYLFSRDMVLDICALKQYITFEQVWNDNYNKILEELQKQSDPIIMTSNDYDGEFGILYDNFDTLSKYSKFYYDRQYFERQIPQFNNEEQKQDNIYKKFLEEYTPKYFKMDDQRKQSLSRSENKSDWSSSTGNLFKESSWNLLRSTKKQQIEQPVDEQEQKIINILQLIHSISCFKGTQFKFERKLKEEPNYILKYNSYFNYNNEVEKLIFQLHLYKNTNVTIHQIINILMKTIQPAFIPFKNAYDATKLIEQFYFNTQLLQEQIDYENEKLSIDKQQYEKQQDYINKLKQVNLQDDYRDLESRVMKNKLEYIKLIDFYEILKFKNEQQKKHQISILEYAGQYKSVNGIDCKVRDNLFYDTNFLYNYKDFETNNQMQLRQLEDKYGYLQQTCQYVGKKYGLDMEPIELFKQLDLILQRMLRKMKNADQQKIKESKKMIRNEFLKNLAKSKAQAQLLAEQNEVVAQYDDTPAVNAQTRQEKRQLFNCKGMNLIGKKHITIKNQKMMKLVQEQEEENKREKNATELFYNQ